MQNKKLLNILCIVYIYMFWSFGTVGFNLSESRVALNPGIDGVRDVASTIISHVQTQLNRVCCFHPLDAGFPNDPLIR